MSRNHTAVAAAIDLAESVGRYAHQDFVPLRETFTAAETIEQLRQADLSDKILYLYVVDGDQRLTGVVPVRRLLSAAATTKIDTLMLGSPVFVRSDATMMEAGQTLLEHRLLAVPVVDEQRRLTGVIDVTMFAEEMLNVERRQHTENVFQMIGIHLSAGRRISAWAAFRQRFPWLLCNLASGLACALVAARFEGLLSRVALLAMFLTLVLALGESVSMQAMTLTLQHLTRQRLSWRRMLGLLWRESKAALLLGMGCAVVVASLVAFGWRQPAKAIVIGCSLVLSVLTACLLGVAIPTLIRLLRVDPKVAAGPIVLASADVMTVLYYFGLMEWWVTASAA